MYGGANGSKISVKYNGEDYMLKFPPKPTKTDSMSYTNSCISEFVSCQIFNSIGVKAQETLLGTYRQKDKEYVAVACKDFTSKDTKLFDFGQLKNTIIDSLRGGYGTDIDDILESIESQTLVNKKSLKEFFWDVFIVDSLLGNWDRHNGNWGFLVDEYNHTAEIAPVFDCGSCLYPQLTESEMEDVLNDRAAINSRIFSYPTSAIYENGKRINYFDYVTSIKNEDCNEALKRIAPRIDMDEIHKIVESTPYIGETQKMFYKTMIQERKERIIDLGLEKLHLRNRKEEAKEPQMKAPASRKADGKKDRTPSR